MGYSIEQEATEFKIIAANVPKVLEAIHSIPPGDYDWVDKNFRTLPTLEKTLDAWNWSIKLGPEGNIVDILFEGQNDGHYEILMEAMAPFVEPNSYIQMAGEDHMRWRWIFKDGHVTKAFVMAPYTPSGITTIVTDET
jgi:hypothetical protein